MAYQQYEEVEEIRQGTFDWRIERYMMFKFKTKISPEFQVGTSKCSLRIFGRNKKCRGCSSLSAVYLFNLGLEAFSNKTVYKLSFIADNKEFFYKKRNFYTIASCISLAIFDDQEISYEFLIDDVLTLRLSWYQEDDFSVDEQGNPTMLNLTANLDSPKFLETLSKDFKNFYESQMDTDCMLRVGDSQISVHRQVLSARSTVFAAMFSHDTSENRSGVVHILDVDASVFSDVIHYIYSGQIRGMSSDTAAAMYIVADKYALFELRDASLDVLMRHLTIENVCDAAIVAHRHGESKLEEKIVLFIDEKLEELDESDDWIQFSKDEPILSMKLLRSAYLASRKRHYISPSEY